MCVYYYKAYDRAGIKKRGVIDAPDERSADRRLRRTGLRPYVICDFELVKHKAKKHRKREKRLIGGGVVLIAAAVWFSGFIVAYAGRDQAPDLAAYEKVGAIAGANRIVYGESPQEREFATAIADIWDSFAPGTLDGLEASTVMVTAYVNAAINAVPEGDVDSLLAQILKAHRRRFGTSRPVVLLIANEQPMLEATYSDVTRTIDVVVFE